MKAEIAWRRAGDLADLRGVADLVRDHRWLCHPDGEPCPDGCDVPANPDRLRIYQAGGGPR